MQFTINLTAGVKVRQETAGAYFLIMSTGAASAIEVALMKGTEPLERVTDAARGMKARMLAGQRFDRVELLSSVDAVVQVIISDGFVDFDFINGTSVSATIAGPLPLPVKASVGDPVNVVNNRGTEAVPIYTRPAGVEVVTVANAAAVAMTSAAAQIIAANAARREIRFANIGTNPVAIGAAGITWATRVIVIPAGGVYTERTGAHLAWSGICDAAMTASVTTQSLTV